MSIDMNTRVDNVTLTRVIGVSPDEDGKKAGNTKKVNVVMTFNGVTLGDVFNDAMKSDIIKLQNTLRPRFESIVDGETINRTYRAPAQRGITDEAAEAHYTNKFTQKSREEQLAEIAKLEAMINEK